jgi:DNA-binding transcriptional regulator GbsR (MarR family)
LTSVFNHNLEKESLRKRLDEIDFLFSSSSDHAKYIYGFIPGGLKCQRCDCADLVIESGDRTALCLNCRNVNHLTANTPFHGVRRIEDWVRAICLLEDGVCFSANMFAELTGMAQSSVSTMLKKLYLIMAEKMKSDMEDHVLQDSAEFLEVVRKRSLQTPANQHPQTEQDVFDELARNSENTSGDSIDAIIEQAVSKIYLRKADDQDTSASNSESSQSPPVFDGTVNLWESEKAVYKLLSYEPITFDHLVSKTGLSTGDLTATLMHLGLGGLVDLMPGDRYVQRRIPLPSNAASAIKKVDPKPFCNYVLSNLHGISRKYLQLYLAAYWCSADRKRWGAGSLFRACSRAPRITYDQILAYVSPHMVKCHSPKER